MDFFQCTKGTDILNVLATDDDFDDSVIYKLEDNDFSLSDIFPNGSVTISTTRDNVFDYEKIKVVYIQIIAEDTLKDVDNSALHSVSQQIKINVIDVNDEAPRIFLPFETIEIEENSKTGTELITNEADTPIRAEDVDTEAKLKFEIIWDKCRASKSGSPVSISKIKDVFSIETEYPNKEEAKTFCSNPNLAKQGCARGVLKVGDKEKLDYETFDTILLNIKVTDEDQEINVKTDEGMMTITLIDENDNPPIFTESTIKSLKNVVEHSDNDVVIGVIEATDADGPPFNEVEYYIKPRDDIDDDLITIDIKTGELIVKNGENIDADWPDYVTSLNYTVIATDSKFETFADISIIVDDINDEVPFLKKDGKPDYVDVIERKSDEEKRCFNIIKGDDYDREKPHNVVNYYINDDFNDLHQKFEIDENTGEFCAHGNIQWSTAVKEIQIYCILKDNLGSKPNEMKFNFIARIQDTDNNPPVLPTKPSDERTIREDTAKGGKVFDIIATDKDEPCTSRSKIDYSITKIMNSKQEPVKEKLFAIKYKQGDSPECEQIAEIIVNADLKNYYGTFTITIHAQNPDTKDNSDEKDYEIKVEPVNYAPPSIIFPKEKLFVLKDKQTVGEKLKYTDGSDLNDFEATDNQDGKYEMTFSIKGDASIKDVFELKLKPEGNKNKARLTVRIENPGKEYELTLRAEHNGFGSSDNFVEQTITLQFVDEALQPFFKKDPEPISFVENSTDIRCKEIEPAIDPKCDSSSDHCYFQIYYHILTPQENFYLKSDNPKKPEICLLQDLDREEQEYHFLDILASNYEQAPKPPPSNPGQSLVKLTVEVEDINDNPPSFPSSKLFQGSLLDSNEIETVIIELKAFDPDSSDEGKLWYELDENSVKISDLSLESVKSNAFKVKEGTNFIINQFAPTQKMRGYFTYDVYVYDTLPLIHWDKAQVRIYVISDEMRITFKFNEDLDYVKNKKTEIENIFTITFEYGCTIDKFEKKSNTTSDTRESVFITEIKTHFIDNNDEPVEKEIISDKLKDPAIVGTLRLRFKDVGLTLVDIQEETSVTNEAEDLNYLLQILLIVVSVVLGTLCIILIVAFILRTRSLKKRLDAMTTNVFGSTKSDLNRIGISAPGTNRHAIEANPVWNEDLNNVNQFDTISQTSGGSDLIGIEDRPDFEYNRPRASINPVVQQMYQENENYENGFIPRNHSKSTNEDDDEINSLPGSINRASMF